MGDGEKVLKTERQRLLGMRYILWQHQPYFTTAKASKCNLLKFVVSAMEDDRKTHKVVCMPNAVHSEIKPAAQLWMQIVALFDLIRAVGTCWF